MFTHLTATLAQLYACALTCKPLLRLVCTILEVDHSTRGLTTPSVIPQADYCAVRARNRRRESPVFALKKVRVTVACYLLREPTR